MNEKNVRRAISPAPGRTETAMNEHVMLDRTALMGLLALAAACGRNDGGHETPTDPAARDRATVGAPARTPRMITQRKGGRRMHSRRSRSAVVGFVLASLITWFPFQRAQAQGNTSTDFVPPKVFQAAGPNAASIQGTVEAYRAALGALNGNTPGPLAGGRREINWDGGGAADTTTAPVTPFDVFLNTRGSRFTTPGMGLSQAPPSGGPQGGLAALFGNPTYGAIFSTFSPLRLFTPVGSNITEGVFFVPGTNGTVPATISGFGAVFTDVDQPDGSGPGKKQGNRGASTLIEYFGRDGDLLFSSSVPASPGDGSLSFFGVLFDGPAIASVRITSGDVAPGPNDDGRDIVMMDDFIYGEPQRAP
jgi:hypothetical protein